MTNSFGRPQMTLLLYGQDHDIKKFEEQLKRDGGFDDAKVQIREWKLIDVAFDFDVKDKIKETIISTGLNHVTSKIPPIPKTLKKLMNDLLINASGYKFIDIAKYKFPHIDRSPFIASPYCLPLFMQDRTHFITQERINEEEFFKEYEQK